MIISFKHKGLETLFHTGSAAGIQTIHRKRLREVLTVLNVARGPEDLQSPSWRLTFRFVDTDVELLDYLAITNSNPKHAQPRSTR